MNRFAKKFKKNLYGNNIHPIYCDNRHLLLSVYKISKEKLVDYSNSNTFCVY